MWSSSFRLEIVESIPENISFGDIPLPRSTYDAWNSLVSESKSEILIAAYKSSLRGIHVFGDQNQSFSRKVSEEKNHGFSTTVTLLW